MDTVPRKGPLDLSLWESLAKVRCQSSVIILKAKVDLSIYPGHFLQMILYLPMPSGTIVSINIPKGVLISFHRMLLFV